MKPILPFICYFAKTSVNIFLLSLRGKVLQLTYLKSAGFMGVFTLDISAASFL